jgi:hypothetical protein
MKFNDVKAEHLGGGAVLFRKAIELNWPMAIGFAQDAIAQEKTAMYTLDTDPATGKEVYRNRSGYFFDLDSIDLMPGRASAIHTYAQDDARAMLEFIEDCKDKYLLKYIELFPVVLKNIWWKVKGHVASYGPNAYLGPHSDTSTDYTYGVMHPQEQLAMRSTLSCAFYLNDSVDTEEELDGTNFTQGHHVFNYLDVRVVPKQGDLLLFPANYMATHEVEPVGQGVRYSYLGWYSHGTPNPAVHEDVVDPIENSTAASVSTNIYMPTLVEDFRTYARQKGITNIDTLPGFTFD